MRALKTHRTLVVLLLLLIVAAPAMSQDIPKSRMGRSNVAGLMKSTDSLEAARLLNIAYMAHRVDSLQFIVVYNADLLRRDLDSKVVWIYVMLGVMIVASMLMFGALNQAQRQRKDLEEKVFEKVAQTTAELRAQIKNVEDVVHLKQPLKPAASPRKKKRT